MSDHAAPIIGWPWAVPTIVAGKYVGEKAEIDGFFPEVVRPKAAAIGPQIFETFSRAYAAGVKIAFGTDCGVSPHGSNGEEFVILAESFAGPIALALAQSLALALLALLVAGTDHHVIVFLYI